MSDRKTMPLNSLSEREGERTSHSSDHGSPPLWLLPVDLQLRRGYRRACRAQMITPSAPSCKRWVMPPPNTSATCSTGERRRHVAIELIGSPYDGAPHRVPPLPRDRLDVVDA